MINILYCGNLRAFSDNYTSVVSMCDNTKEPLNITFLTIYIPDVEPKGRPLTAEHEKLMDAYVKSINPKSSYKVIDVTPQFRERLLVGKNLHSSFSPYANIRLVADQIPAVPDRVIYLDNDTIIPGDIKEFWDVNISDHEVGVIKDIYKAPWSSYFNSGVMIIDMKKIRESKLFSRAIDLVQTKKMLYPDQTALNILTTKTKKMLPRKFNSMSNGHSKCVIHHICNVREGKVFLIGKWWHRLKTNETELIRKRLPLYDKYFNMLEAQIAKTPHLFPAANVKNNTIAKK